ncbi:sulfatase-like hydrolase/transferase [Rhodopirellula sp. MGV]|uniref:sulfatase-like hydrolase/transferase n=1 Tax=Rhodopirellula sp. MGV TaxID=2023130 RepID=UPI0018E957F2|nr:sulfatase-like hydrolase/transferase [Rhodopirellula sp. MGV]
MRVRMAVVLALWFLVGVTQAQSEQPPNVLLILADDLGYSDLGCYGGEIQTPNLDSIAEQGLRFSQFYNTGRCWPTRGSLMTGYYAQQIRRDYLPGVPSGGRGSRPAWAWLVPELLRDAGYRSYHTGKWHLDGQPLENGFDVSSQNQVGRYFQPLPDHDGKEGRSLQFRDDFYLTSAMANDVVRNLRDHQAKHSSKPFFQYLAFTAPHFPLHALPEDIDVYRGVYDVGWDVIRERRFESMRKLGILPEAAVDSPASVERELGPPYHFPEAFEILGEGEVNKPIPWSQLTESQRRFQATKMTLHAAMIHRMDIEIGRVFDQVREMGAWDNTLILFLSDNGASAEIMVRGDGHDPNASPGSGHSYLCLGPGWSTVCNTPFRRHKTWTHEGGIATPFLLSWPDQVQSGGQIRRGVHHVIDVVPTLLSIAGVPMDPQTPPLPGESFANQINQASVTDARTLWWFHDAHRAIRVGDWKAVAPKDEPWELYDLSQDRTEQVDLAIPKADKLTALIHEWESMTQQMTKLASEDLNVKQLEKAQGLAHTSETMLQAQEAAQVPRTQHLLGGESFRVADRHAFLIEADQPFEPKQKPWVFYAPTLRQYPDANEEWIFRRLLDASVSVAGIDVGEGYGSPHCQAMFDALCDEMVRRGFSSKPALLGRSRGGLAVSRFAIERPERVGGIAGIYPVFDYTSYPGVQRAASVYGVTAEELLSQQDAFNPIKKAGEIADAKIPVYLIHGTEDKVVPIEANSDAFAQAYREAGKSDLMTVKRIRGQGHNLFEGFFRDQALVDFLISAARGE